MNARERVRAYRKQAGVEMDKPFILTPAQRRRIKQKSNQVHHQGFSHLNVKEA